MDTQEAIRPLDQRLTDDSDEILDRFLEWVTDLGFELFPAQEEALLELMADRHVILNTPTGSGKSLVAAGLHFKYLCEGKTSYYTAPIKALVSEKFFALCRDFGADNVGMLTGDASINPEAPILCCTAEVLSNMALRRRTRSQGGDLAVDAVVMDEFHYYSDTERGVAWQIPLISMPETAFLLMSATLGNPAPIREHLDRQTVRETSVVTSHERPVPLDYEYRETPIHETVQELLDSSRSPIYIVNFTQRECAELASNLTSLKLTDKDEKATLREAMGEFRFDTNYGKEMKRFLGFGIGIHHAGLLPKYRLLVEQLSQQGLLKVVCGTDTLGVGVNIPIRTVLFNKLCKFDGTQVGILSVRDFKQIGGRAGRKGFDDRGWVVCQAPEHVIENKRLIAKSALSSAKNKKLVKKKPPTRGYVPWDETTFRSLVERPPETLQSQFRVDHGMILDTLQRDAEGNDPEQRNFYTLRRLIEQSHETPERKQELVREAAVLTLALYRGGILQLVKDTRSSYKWIGIDPDLQFDFSMMHTLSLYLVESLQLLDPEAETHALDVVTLVESILEDPKVILRRQTDVARDHLYNALKAEGVPYEERQERLEKVTHPKPNQEFLYQTFNAFRRHHPWLAGEGVKPKSIGREMLEGYLAFGDFIDRYGLKRSEGVLLRYLSQLYKTLTQTVPDEFKTEELWDALGFFRTLLSRVDTSLLDEWESMLDPDSGLSRLAGTETGEAIVEALELISDPKAFRARIRAEIYQLVRALARQDWEEAAHSVRQSERHPFPPEAFEEAMRPFFEQYETLVFTPAARQANWTSIVEQEPRLFSVRHTLLDPEDDNLWGIEGRIDLRQRHLGPDDKDPLIDLVAISQ